MLRNKANGLADCLVTEMLQCLPTQTVYEVAHWFDKRFKRECGAPEAWKILRLVFLKKARRQARTRPTRVPCDSTAECVSKWYTTVLVHLFHEENAPVVWEGLHVGAERGVNCEHMQALVTNIFQRHWEWQEDRRTDLQPRIVQIQYGFYGKLGLEDGRRCG